MPSGWWSRRVLRLGFCRSLARTGSPAEINLSSGLRQPVEAAEAGRRERPRSSLSYLPLGREDPDFEARPAMCPARLGIEVGHQV